MPMPLPQPGICAPIAAAKAGVRFLAAPNCFYAFYACADAQGQRGVTGRTEPARDWMHGLLASPIFDNQRQRMPLQ